MELDNIIYIIITIGIFIVSLLGQYKKKKVPAPIDKDDVIYSLNDFEKILERKEEYRVIEQQNHDIEEFNQKAELIQEFPEDEKKKTSKRNLQKDENEINDGFDIKTAVIYSSILERKKFRH